VGAHGYAFIPLKDNGVPQQQKPISLHGERGGNEADYRGLAGTCIYGKVLVKNMKWLNQGFPVQKKAKPP
jgi:hypothetical protein